MLKRLVRSPRVQAAAGLLGAGYLKLVFRTNGFTIDPPDIYDRVDAELPVILAMWHGQHFMSPFIRRPYHRAKVLISRHHDGEINAQVAERLGVGTIRGSGDMKGRFHTKGGPAAFRAMLESLNAGWTVALTADVPKVSRRAGMGIVKLASYSGRPIVPLAMTTSRRIDLNNWDRTTISLPFGRGAAVVGDWVRVRAHADDEELEAARLEVEASLNVATERALALVDRRDG